MKLAKRLGVASVMVMLAVFSMMGAGVSAQHPNPVNPGVSDEGDATATPISAEDAGCDLIEDYASSVNGALTNSGEFWDFLIGPTVYNLSTSDAKGITADGEALIEELNGLDVPPAYAGAHEGLLAWMQFELDFVTFSSEDTSSPPNVNAQIDGFEAIYQGEENIAAACPDEIDAVGGYILLDPNDK